MILIGLASICMLVIVFFSEDIPIVIDGSIYLLIVVSIVVFNIIALIANRKLENNKKTKIPIILFIIIIIIEVAVLLIVLIIHLKNVNIFNETMEKMKDYEEEETYYAEPLLKKDVIFLDKNGKEFNRIENTNYYSFHEYRINKNGLLKSVYLGNAVNGRNTELINSKGEKICTLTNIDDYEEFTKAYKKLYGKVSFEMKVNFSKQIDEKYNYLELTDIIKENNNKYMYFKNPEWGNKILQVVIKDEPEIDEGYLKIYEKYKYIYEDTLDYDKMNEFYHNKKEFYIVDLNDNNSKIKIECNNLIYRAEKENDSEKILLFTNGYIPFYEDEKNGCFNEKGEKFEINSDSLVYDALKDNCFIYDKTNKKTIVYSTTKNKKIKELDGIVANYEVLIESVSINENGKNSIIDEYGNILKNNLNTITPLNRNLFIEADDNHFNLYYYDSDTEKITKINEMYYMSRIQIDEYDGFRTSNIYEDLFMFEYEIFI